MDPGNEQRFGALLAGTFTGLLIVFRTVSYISLVVATSGSEFLTPYFGALLAQWLWANVVGQLFYLIRISGPNPTATATNPKSSAAVAKSIAIRWPERIANVLRSDSATAFVIFGQSSTLAPYFATMIPHLVSNYYDYDASADLVSWPAADDTRLRNTVFVMLLVCILLVGCLHYLLGKLNLGRFLNLFPFPVTRGFFAAFGLSMIVGAATISAGFNVRKRYERLASPANDAGNAWARILAALAIGVGLKLVRTFQRRPLHFPMALVTTLVVFFIGFGIGHGATGVSIADLREQGWIMNVDSPASVRTAFNSTTVLTSTAVENDVYSFWTFYDPSTISWITIASLWSQFGGLLVLATFDMAVQLPPLGELMEQQAPPAGRQSNEGVVEIDFNRELQHAGEGQILCFLLGGGGACYHTVSPTKISVEAGGGGQYGGLAAACSLIINLIAFAAGPTLVTYLPTPFVSGLLIYAGLSYVIEGLYDSRRTMTRLDYLVVAVIIISSFIVDMIQAVGVGLALACVLFIYRYASSPFVRSVYHPRHLFEGPQRLPTTDGATSVSSEMFVDEYHKRMVIMKLQGYLFFGCVETVASRFRALLQRSRSQRENNHHPSVLVPVSPSLQALVLDFNLVFGLDASALDTLLRLKKYTVTQHVLLVLAGLGKHKTLTAYISEQCPELLSASILPRSPVIAESDAPVFDKLEAAIEWTEMYLWKLNRDPHHHSTGVATDELEVATISAGPTRSPIAITIHSPAVNSAAVVLTPPIPALVPSSIPLRDVGGEKPNSLSPVSVSASLGEEMAASHFVTVFKEQLQGRKYVSRSGLSLRILRALGISSEPMTGMVLFPVSAGRRIALPAPLEMRHYLCFVESGVVDLMLPMNATVNVSVNTVPAGSPKDSSGHDPSLGDMLEKNASLRDAGDVKVDAAVRQVTTEFATVENATLAEYRLSRVCAITSGDFIGIRHLFFDLPLSFSANEFEEKIGDDGPRTAGSASNVGPSARMPTAGIKAREAESQPAKEQPSIVPIASTDCVIRAFSVNDLWRMQQRDPVSSMIIHRLVNLSLLRRWTSTADALLNHID